MHPRSPYAKAPPNFAALALKHPNFAKHVKVREDGTSSIDFQDADSVRALTEMLLLEDFKIVAEQAPDRLCPTVPNRLNYVLWLQDLVAETRRVLTLARRSSPVPVPDLASSSSSANAERPAKRARLCTDENVALQRRPSLRGLDIGTGASAIYPLLMCATDPDAEMVGTDIDEFSIAHANKIVAHPANTHLNLQTRIRIVSKRPDDPFFSGLGDDKEKEPRYHITMCNPPFFSSKEDMLEGSFNKIRKPPAVCTGTEREMIYRPLPTEGDEGGEVGFVRRMIEESFASEKGKRNTIWWYTSMLGRLSSVDTLLHALKVKASAATSADEEGQNLTWTIHELVQGNTKRWVLAWSFSGVHISANSESGTTVSTLTRHQQPSLLKIDWLAHTGDVNTARERLERVLGGISDVDVLSSENDHQLEIVVWSQSWTRAARRAMKRGEAVAVDDDKSKEAILCIEATIRTLSSHQTEEKGASSVKPEATMTSVDSSAGGSASAPNIKIDFRWTFGHSRPVFDSFLRHVKNQWAALASSRAGGEDHSQ
ncbi:hypothetical protein A4X13_0g6015 [Tilletia indica]|uniref:Uncharacterized protein n=1 Tax=Tilletia indica TaxID=43049 RepID=A0A177TN97_9BASI|nr:hypothetical protein A4X13_0g6015 [Tilletia indica]